MKIFDLPENYKEIRKIDLSKNIKLSIFVNVLALIIAIILLFLGIFLVPLNYRLLSEQENLFVSLAPPVIVMFEVIAYLFLHEWIHGIYFKKYSGRKAKYGFTGLYAYAKSDGYFNKKEYLVIGLAPVVVFGILCLALNIILQSNLFWFIYIVQIVNLSGAAGDFYVAYVMTKLPDDILIKDNGDSMTIYSSSSLSK